MADRKSADEGIVHQVLHGYRHGHELLGSTVDLDDDTANVLNHLSDSAPNVRVSDGPYLTGYPLPDGRYVIARTWHVTEAQRPNTVMTHSLILPTGTPPRFSALGILDALAVPTDADSPETLSPIDIDALTGPPLRLDPRDAEIAARYYGPPRPLWALHFESRDAIALAIWKQVWRSARYNLRFCTAPDADRFSKNERSIRFESEPAIELGDHTRPAHALIVDDLIEPGAFREFLHFVAAGEKAIGLVEPFAAAYLLLEARPGAVDPFVAWLLQYRGIEPRRLRRLKRRFLGFRGEDQRWAVDPLMVLEALTDGPLGEAVYASDASLDRWIRSCWNANPERTADLLHQASSEKEVTPSGPPTATEGLAESFTNQASRLITPATLPLAVTLNRNAALAAVLERNEPALWRAWAALDNPGPAGRSSDSKDAYPWDVAVAALRADTGGISRLLYHYPEALDALISAADREPLDNDGDLDLTYDAKRYIRNRLEKADPELAGLARLSAHDVLPHRLDTAAWASILNRTTDPAVLATAYLISREAPQDHCEVASTAMASLYKRLAADDSPEAWERLEPHLRGDRGTWDRCHRLAIDFASVIKRYNVEHRLKAVQLVGPTSKAAANAIEQVVRSSKSKKFKFYDPTTWF